MIFIAKLRATWIVRYRYKIPLLNIKYKYYVSNEEEFSIIPFTKSESIWYAKWLANHKKTPQMIYKKLRNNSTEFIDFVLPS